MVRKRVPITERTLKQLRKDIADEVRFVGLKPYSHNLVSLALGQIEKRFGMTELIRAMKDFKLDKKGWKIPEEE